MVLKNKQSIAEACRNLGVSRDAMERWLTAEADSHNTDKVRLQQLENEVRPLRKEKADLEDTINILKKRRPVAPPNLLHQDFHTDAPNKIWDGCI